MPVTEKQIVRIVPARLQLFPPDRSRFLDRRKGIVEEVFVPLGGKAPKARVRWMRKSSADREVEMVLDLDDLEVVS